MKPKIIELGSFPFPREKQMRHRSTRTSCREDVRIALCFQHTIQQLNCRSVQSNMPSPLAACDKAVAIKPDVAEAWLGRGNVLLIQLRSGEAFEACDKALALKPDLVEAWLGRANVLLNQLLP